MEYNYKVEFLPVAVSEKELKKGKAGPKIAGQIEVRLRKMVGWEFHSQNVVKVDVTPGCLGRILSLGQAPTESVDVIFLVFRQPID